MNRRARVAAVAVACSIAACAPQAAAPPMPAAQHLDRIAARYVPAPSTTFQWQLTGDVEPMSGTQLYDIDMFENTAAKVAQLHSTGAHVACYIDAGSWEKWRPDAGQFPASVLGKSNGWPGERWLDVRKIAVLMPIMDKRLDQCASKGFDAVEFDNVDGYTNRTGFPLTGSEQLAYNRRLAHDAHARSLAVALKNDTEQVPQLAGTFDFALVEECFQYRECGAYTPFVQAGKAVFETEYKMPRSSFCGKARALGFMAMRKHLKLDRWRAACWTGASAPKSP